MRLTLLLVLFTNYLFAVINVPVHTKVLSIHDQEITTPAVEGAQVGMFGAVVHWFDDTHSTALSWVEIKKIEDDTITLDMVPIRALEQSALPSGKWAPAVGDEVILGYNYQRGLLIAPNSSIYKKITHYHQNRSWIHPDIFAAALSSNGHPTPLREDFSAACRVNNIGIVSFMFDKSIITVDCQSFKILQNKSTSVRADEPQLPFYSRVTHIEANWFGEGSDELEEYSPHYITLIAENNPDNKWIQTYKTAREEATSDNEESWFDSWFENTDINVEIGLENEDNEINRGAQE